MQPLSLCVSLYVKFKVQRLIILRMCTSILLGVCVTCVLVDVVVWWCGVAI